MAFQFTVKSSLMLGGDVATVVVEIMSASNNITGNNSISLKATYKNSVNYILFCLAFSLKKAGSQE